MREPCLRDDALAALEIELAGLGRLDLACRAVPETQPERGHLFSRIRMHVIDAATPALAPLTWLSTASTTCG